MPTPKCEQITFGIADILIIFIQNHYKNINKGVPIDM